MPLAALLTCFAPSRNKVRPPASNMHSDAGGPMQIKIARPSEPKSYEITSETRYWSRRDWLAGLGYAGAAAAMAPLNLAQANAATAWEQLLKQKLSGVVSDTKPTTEALTPY